MNTEQAIEFLKVEQMVPTSGCDYCDDPQGRRFVKYHQWEWMNQSQDSSTPFGGNIRTIKSEGDWTSRHDQPKDPEPPIIGQQTKIHYYCCEKCLLCYANQMYNNISKYIGNPKVWYDQYNKDQAEITERYKKLGQQRVGVSITKEKEW